MVLELAWDDLPRARWEELFASAGRSPLLQSWAWGEAKKAEGWQPRRGVLCEHGQPVGLVQVLEKKMGGVARVARLNRGPVWLAPPASGAAARALSLVGRPWRWWSLGALFLAPEVIDPAELAPLALRRRAAPSWCSAWLDLAEEPDALRKRLDGKWRNMLVGAEKAGLTLDAGGPEALDWLMERYEDLMRGKAFTGTPPSLICAPAANGWRQDDVLVLRALSEGEAVGGILLARHGASATYLVGWNGDAGRKLKANNFLLWQAVLELRRRGVRWFDLGGIDDVLTPGIAAFKRGMKGEEYRLVGEFLRL